MENQEAKEILLLNSDEVNVLTRYSVEIDGELVEAKRKVDVYLNSTIGRAALLASEPENIYNGAVAYWGDTCTVDTESEE